MKGGEFQRYGKLEKNVVEPVSRVLLSAPLWLRAWEPLLASLLRSP